MVAEVGTTAVGGATTGATAVGRVLSVDCRGKHLKTQGYFSTRQHGRKVLKVLGFDHNDGRNYGSKSCRTDPHSEYWSRNQPWHIQASLHQQWDLLFCPVHS